MRGDFLIAHILRHAIECGTRTQLRSFDHLSDMMNRNNLRLRNSMHVDVGRHHELDAFGLELRFQRCHAVVYGLLHQWIPSFRMFEHDPPEPGT